MHIVLSFLTSLVFVYAADPDVCVIHVLSLQPCVTIIVVAAVVHDKMNMI